MKKPKRILVGLKTFEHAVELTDLACRAGTPRTSLLLIHVIELPDPTPLDADVPDLEATARRILRAGERVAHASQMNVKSRIFRARSAGDALLDELKERNIDLAILGYHHPHTLGELVFGTTARHLATNSPCQVLLSIPPRK